MNKGGKFNTERAWAEAVVEKYKSWSSHYKPDITKEFPQLMVLLMYTLKSPNYHIIPVSFTWMPGDRYLDYPLSGLLDEAVEKGYIHYTHRGGKRPRSVYRLTKKGRLAVETHHMWSVL